MIGPVTTYWAGNGDFVTFELIVNMQSSAGSGMVGYETVTLTIQTDTKIYIVALILSTYATRAVIHFKNDV